MSELIDISRPELAWEIAKAFPEETAKKIAEILEGEPKITEGWRSASEKPPCEAEVLIRCHYENHETGWRGADFYTTAMYEDGTMNTEDSDWNWDGTELFEYDEEHDWYIIPEGWYEYRHFNPDDVYNNVVDACVTAWMPIPGKTEDA